MRRRLVHGRRKGHKLGPARQMLMDRVLPGLRLDLSRSAPPALAGLFPVPVDEVWLEIGFGAGEHLAWQAAQNPRTGLIGCEPFINGVASLLSQIEKNGLRNIRVHDDDARDVLDWLPAASLSRAYLLFPDPWPKTRHHKRRFINADNLGCLARILKSGAEFRFASDIPDYVDWTLRHIRRHRDFEWTARGPRDWRERPPDWPQTRYEAKAMREGREPAYLSFVRNGS